MCKKVERFDSDLPLVIIPVQGVIKQLAVWP